MTPFEIVMFVLGVVGMVAYVASLVWVYRDAQRRGRSGVGVALLVGLFAWPLGLVVWLVVRPEA